MKIFFFIFVLSFYQILYAEQDKPNNVPEFPNYKNNTSNNEIKDITIKDYPLVINEVSEEPVETREFDTFIYQKDGVVFYTKYSTFNPGGFTKKDRKRVNTYINNVINKMDPFIFEDIKTYRTRIMAPTTLLNLNETIEDNIGYEYYQYLKYPAQYQEDIEYAMKKEQENMREEKLTPYQKEKQKKEGDGYTKNILPK